MVEDKEEWCEDDEEQWMINRKGGDKEEGCRIKRKCGG
jgi:hypothetical protein